MKEFININGIRIRKATIKRYVPIGNTKINIYFSPSRNKIDVDTIDCKTMKKIKQVISMLDLNFL